MRKRYFIEATFDCKYSDGHISTHRSILSNASTMKSAMSVVRNMKKRTIENSEWFNYRDIAIFDTWEDDEEGNARLVYDEREVK